MVRRFEGQEGVPGTLPEPGLGNVLLCGPSCSPSPPGVVLHAHSPHRTRQQWVALDSGQPVHFGPSRLRHPPTDPSACPTHLAEHGRMEGRHENVRAVSTAVLSTAAASTAAAAVLPPPFPRRSLRRCRCCGAPLPAFRQHVRPHALRLASVACGACAAPVPHSHPDARAVRAPPPTSQPRTQAPLACLWIL